MAKDIPRQQDLFLSCDEERRKNKKMETPNKLKLEDIFFSQKFITKTVSGVSWLPGKKTKISKIKKLIKKIV